MTYKTPEEGNSTLSKEIAQAIAWIGLCVSVGIWQGGAATLAMCCAFILFKTDFFTTHD